MVIRYLLFAVLILSGLSRAAVDVKHLHSLRDARYHSVESEATGRDFHIYVLLPDNYDNAASADYPTIYVLDGGALFPLLTGYYQYLNFGEEVADAIIVGIAYGSDNFEGGNYRSTDFTAPAADRDHWGGAALFQQFLGDELLPFIETTYRSRADRRIIFGQSLGGQFVLYTALTQPQLFWGHIASNPALHRNLPFFLESHASPTTTKDQSKVFVASASHDDARFRQPALEWMQHWVGRDTAPWELKVLTLQGHSHMSAPPNSFREGLRWLLPVY